MFCFKYQQSADCKPIKIVKTCNKIVTTFKRKLITDYRVVTSKNTQPTQTYVNWLIVLFK